VARRLCIVGTSGYAKEVAQIARRVDPKRERWDTISYVSHSAAEKGGSRLFGTVDFCDADLLSGQLSAEIVIGVGEPALRRAVAARYVEIQSFSFPNLIDPTVAFDAELVALGRGNVLHQGVIVTCAIIVGDFNLFNKGAIVSHDVRVGSFNSVQPGAALLSNSSLGDGCMIGTGARVLPKIFVADRTSLGAGAVLLEDVSEPGQVLVGVPAKRLR
jgi:sugar O-acyltransferase (sialic acid O-acetyltransferase NeuD family)